MAGFFDNSGTFGIDTVKIPRFPELLTTLTFLSLSPAKDRAPVNDLMHIDLTQQQFGHGTFDFVALVQWLGVEFKSHCAPKKLQRGFCNGENYRTLKQGPLFASSC